MSKKLREQIPVCFVSVFCAIQNLFWLSSGFWITLKCSPLGQHRLWFLHTHWKKVYGIWLDWKFYLKKKNLGLKEESKWNTSSCLSCKTKTILMIFPFSKWWQVASAGEAGRWRDRGGGGKDHWTGWPRPSLSHLFFSEDLCWTVSHLLAVVAMAVDVHAPHSD